MRPALLALLAGALAGCADDPGISPAYRAMLDRERNIVTPAGRTMTVWQDLLDALGGDVGRLDEIAQLHCDVSKEWVCVPDAMMYFSLTEGEPDDDLACIRVSGSKARAGKPEEVYLSIGIFSLDRGEIGHGKEALYDVGTIIHPDMYYDCVFATSPLSG